MADLNKIIDDLSSLTVVEAAELSKQLEDKWDVKAAAPVVATPVAAAAPAEGGEGKKAEKKDEAATGKSEEAAMEGLSSLFG